MPTMHINIERPPAADPVKVTLPEQAAGRPQPTEVEIPAEDIAEYEAMIAADLGIISGPLVNHQANPQ